MAMARISYINSPGPYSLVYTTIPGLLDERASNYPDMECHVFLDYNKQNASFSRFGVTWSQLQMRSRQVASGLLDMGLKPGDRIAIFGDSSPEWMYMEYACTRIKILKIPIPSNMAHSSKLPDMLGKHNVQLLVMDPGQDFGVLDQMSTNLPRLRELLHDGQSNTSGYPRKLLFLRARGSGNKVPVVTDYLNNVMSQVKLDTIGAIQDALNPDDPACVYASSGSTGLPKLLIHSHFTLINTFVQYQEFLGSGKGEKYFNNYSFDWMGSFHYYTLSNACTRVHLTTQDLSNDEYITVLLQVLRDENIHSAFLLNFLLHDIRKMVQLGSVTLPETFKWITAGGEKVPYDLFADCGKLPGVTVVGEYGASEIPFMGSCSSLDDDNVVGDGPDRHMLYRTSGPVEIKIIDDDGKCVPRGTAGILLTRQAFRFLGYLDDPDMTAATMMPNGWTGPGDIAIMYDSGKFEVLGRTKHLIIRGSVKIYPSKQEAMLLRHSKIAKAVVCGIPDEIYNEEICACVEPKQGIEVTEEELQQHCVQFQPSETSVKLYPTFFLFIQKMPITRNGKIDRTKICNMILDARHPRV